MSDERDFGFTIVDEPNKTEALTTQERLNVVYNMIQPLLDNLKGDIKQDYIHWPGEARHTKIDEFKQKLQDAYNGVNT